MTTGEALRGVSGGWRANPEAVADDDRWLANLAKQFAAIKGESNYTVQWEPPVEVAEAWAARRLSSLRFLSRLIDELETLTLEQIEQRLGWWWRGEDRHLRRAIAQSHRSECERSRGFLVNRSARVSYPAPCRDWRRCARCARAYGRALSERWSKVRDLAAFAVLTMPPGIRERWREKAAIDQMMAAWRRLYERLCRRFGRRPKLMHFKEHAGESGGLHLNVLWDFAFIEQRELSRLAAACGFGPVCHISAVGSRRYELMRGRAGSSPAIRYTAKEGFRVRAYARKTGSETAGSGDDWPKSTRRWSASRAASCEMGRRARNRDWCWLSFEPNFGPPCPSDSFYYLLADRYLPTRSPSLTATTEPPRSPPEPRQFGFGFRVPLHD